MQLGLGLGLGAKLGGGAVNAAPVDVAWAGSHTVAEDAAFGTVVGGVLSATDPEGDAVTFSIPDAASMFAISGTSVIVAGVLDFETETSHDVTIRATDTGGNSFDEQFTITVTDVAEDSPEDPPPDDDPVVDNIDNFEIVPYTVVVDGSVKFAGKKKNNGLSAKFLHDFNAVLPLEAGTVYDVEFTADFSLMAQDGRLAMVGVVFKQGNDFWMIGPRGDGLTGLDAYQIYGDDLWNQVTGFTEIDGGALQHGTQWGPIRFQVETSVDGETVSFRTSGDDGETFDDDFTDAVPLPFGNISEVTQWGIGGIFHSEDSGPYSINVTLFITRLVDRQFVTGGVMPTVVNAGSVNRIASVGGTFVQGI